MFWGPAVCSYLVALVIYAFIKHRELARDPAKAQRYRVLPFPYKFACWCGVLPLLVALPAGLFFVEPVFALLAALLGIGAYAGLEIACVAIYRKHGLWK